MNEGGRREREGGGLHPAAASTRLADLGPDNHERVQQVTGTLVRGPSWSPELIFICFSGYRRTFPPLLHSCPSGSRFPTVSFIFPCLFRVPFPVPTSLPLFLPWCNIELSSSAAGNE